MRCVNATGFEWPLRDLTWREYRLGDPIARDSATVVGRVESRERALRVRTGVVTRPPVLLAGAQFPRIY